MTAIVVNIMVELLFTLSLAMRHGRMSESLLSDTSID
jgi:hypothetical protein